LSRSPSARSRPSLHRAFTAWWPLATSWLLMALELPALSAVVARLPDPRIHLAAYGGVVFPLALIVESPVIMLLAASTALSRDADSYRRLHRYMTAAGAGLTALHVLVAFTPLYDLVAAGLLGAPAEILEPARLGLRIMTPWTWSIAYRRFHQGVLIRFGRSRTVGIGTAVRLSADGLVLAAGFLAGTFPGIAVATAAVAAGVVSEAVFVGLRARPIVRGPLQQAPPPQQPIAFLPFLRFYVPLAMTSLLLLLSQPLGAAAMSRMPRALDSLAVWPVVSGVIFIFRSLGMAYNEVVVALVDTPRAQEELRRFTVLLLAGTSLALALMVSTALARFWFQGLSGLPPRLADLALRALWIALPIPGLTVLHSWYQGILVNSRHTRGVTEAMACFLLIAVGVLLAGMRWGQFDGLFVAVAALGAGAAAQAAWLRRRAGPAMLELSRVPGLQPAGVPAQLP
jgi:hypothetical protein